MLIRNVKASDLNEIVRIEYENFSIDERASKSSLKNRIDKIADTFLVAEIDNRIVGYVVGPISTTKRLDDSLFEKVDKNPEVGGYIAVLSLSVDHQYKGQGIGTALLAALKDLAVARKSNGITLTCHEELISYYEMNGFEDIGVSESTHGNAVWYDMLWLTELPN